MNKPSRGKGSDPVATDKETGKNTHIADLLTLLHPTFDHRFVVGIFISFKLPLKNLPFQKCPKYLLKTANYKPAFDRKI